MEKTKVFDFETDGISISKKSWHKLANIAIGLGLLGFAGTDYVVVNHLSPKSSEHSLTLNLPQFPNKLPVTVLKQIDDLVSVQTNLPGYTTGIGSGILISKTRVLTAGHVINSPDNKPIKGIDNCAALQIDSKFGEQYPTKEIATYKDEGTTRLPDVALLESAFNFPYSPVHLDRSQIKQGQRLYFANYEPTASGAIRDPLSLSHQLSLPAVYGGVVIGKQQNGDIEVLTGIKGYQVEGAAIKDSHTRPGSSGGPAFNANGQLIGTVVELIAWNSSANRTETTLTVNKFESFNNIKINNALPNLRLQETIIQPIGATLISKMTGELTGAKPCSQNYSIPNLPTPTPMSASIHSRSN